MNLHIRVVEAADVPKMDVAGKSDPYVLIKSSKSSQTYQTKHKNNTDKPVWNEEFTIPITSAMDDILTIEMYDKDTISKDDIISKIAIQVNKIPPGKVNDSWYTMHPLGKLTTGGKLRLVVHLAKQGQPAFQ